MKKVYRWYVVDNQEMSFLSIVELLEGYFETEEDAIKSVSDKYNFFESLFSVRKIEDSEVDAKFVKSVGGEE